MSKPIVPDSGMPGELPGNGSIKPGQKIPVGAIPAGAVPGAPVPGTPVPGNAIPGNAIPGQPVPGGAIPPGELPDLPPPGPGMPGPGGGKIRMKEMPKMSARPYFGRVFQLSRGHMGLITVSLLISIVIFLLPFIAAAALGPLLQLFGKAAETGNWNNVWTLTGSFYDNGGQQSAFLPGFISDWLSTPIGFTTIFVVWTGAIVLNHVLNFCKAWIDANLEQGIITQFRQRVYEHIQSLSLDFFLGGQTGALMQRVLSETGSVQRLLTQVLLTPVVDLIVLVIVISYLLALSWQMTIVLFLLAPMTLVMFRFTSAKLQEGAMGINVNSRQLASELEETINGISDIQVFNAQPKRNERFLIASRNAARSSASTSAWMGLSNSGAQIFISLTTALILLAAIMMGQKWGLTFATAIVFTQMAPNLFTPIQRLIGSYTMYQSLVPGVVSTFELLDTKPSIVEKPGAISLPEVHGDIDFQHVVFGYSPTQKVLNDISFSIKEGETIAFVGPIGCGKSTIMNLMLRFLEPESGRILLEGKDISDVTLTSLREQVSKLSQFPFFLRDTIRENVRLGKANATDAEIEAACKLAHIHDVIIDPQRMPKGYDTIVDVQVPSGGQKRLIALARCLLRKPEVLMLDEPTENLDADQRNRLISVIREYAKDRTCMVISHDLGFVSSVSDRIIVIDKGRVVDEGTHDELVQREGLYKTLYNLKNVDPALLKKRDDKASAAPMGLPSLGGMMPGGPMMM